MTTNHIASSAPATLLGTPRQTLRFERRLATDLDDAWTLVSDPARVARWFAPVTVGDDDSRTRPQDAVGRTWTTHWDDGREYATGTIVRCEPPHLLEVTWTASDDADEASADSVLRVSLTEQADGVLLTLEHEGLGETDLVQYGAGWHTYLDRLGDGRFTVIDWSARYAELEPVYRRLTQAGQATDQG
ncbi:SRPBCC domain-containing protein [Cellulomonas bogoriensis]|uniref:ATPase n=1 Tax=Cellulomonas bogoriensis 69B4 = DSM 16987 TaxID=1386082 RepID=A0A0A0BNV2_9CELL|nr:SRPBCC domain-containing protein [Cellulomonas bogoriensis]KGM10168.1 ATPase [Cellulomonas bogoriensis 69B4 = DSM 16987]